MKNLFNLNLAFIGFPILLCLLGIFDPAFVFWGFLSTILTGLFQLIVGFGMLKDEPKDKDLQRYAFFVALFFSCWIASAFLETASLVMHYLFVLPPLLAAYLTFIIYKKRNL